VSLLQKVLKQHPVGLVFDIDGTLSPIAPTPDDARLYPHVTNLLRQASEHAHVAIMTGRTINNGAAMVNVEGLTYIGTHGLEWSNGLPTKHSVRIDPEAEAYIEPSKILLDLADQNLTHLPGLLVERKFVGGSIHYRLCSNPEEARQTILALLQEPAKQFNLLLSEGKRVIEIKAPVSMNKGKAIRRFTQIFALRAIVFAGDDRTDLDAIMEVASLKKEGIAGLSIVVQHFDTLKLLLENADIIVQEVEGMVELLQVIVENLK
jgi:trehalose 6-phosphate phosphatase